jgi:hypothetical protein
MKLKTALLNLLFISFLSFAQPNIVWQKSLGVSGVDETRSIQQTSDGGYIVGGGTQSNDGDISGNHGSRDGLILKLTDNGAIVWQKLLGGSFQDSAGYYTF